tara:strand:- start:1972 stop:5112 length:3141 start_codon:yes stop_codon:yes gene_type:complete
MAKKKYDRIKIAGYAKRVFFNDNIEYRNFSPDLCGFQITSEGGTTLFTNCNFSIDVNLEPKPEVVFKQGAQSKPYTLDDIVTDDTELAIQKNLNAGLNLNLTDPLSFVWYGSASELIRSSLGNIFDNWPAAIYVDNKIGSITGNNITNYVYDISKDESTFTINSNYFINPYDIKYTVDEGILGTEESDNPLRNFTVKYASYTIEHNGIIKNIKNITPSSQVTNATLDLTVDGNPFPELTGIFIPQYTFFISGATGSLPFFIKPNEVQRENFFTSLSDMQQNLLNRDTVPPYTSIIIAPQITDTGVIVTTKEKFVFPLLDDGYNLNFFDSFYLTYLDTINEVGKNYDEFNTDLIIRKYTAEVISSFDTVPRGDGDDLELDGEKATKLLRIYGVGFDETKKYINGIKLAHVVTYNKQNNIPDSLVKDLSQMLGLQPGNFVTNIELNNTVLPSIGSTPFSGSSTSLSPQQIDIELYRRLILNLAWMWRNKGTRKAVEFLFRFIGAPESIVTFNEYIVIVDKPLDMDKIKQLLYMYTGEEPDVSNIPYDKNGFPLPPTNGSLVINDFISGPDQQSGTGATSANLGIVENNVTEMYFQKAGGWYRETFGKNVGNTILRGNNPHVGPYDGGNEYLNYFSQCYIPNFTGTSAITLIEKEVSNNVFWNYNYGIFNDISVDTPVFVSEIVYNPIENNYQVISEDCIDINYNIIETPLQEEGTTTLEDSYTIAKAEYDAYLELIKKDSYLKYSPEWQIIKYNYDQATKRYKEELTTQVCVPSGSPINQALEICITPLDQSVNVEDVSPCDQYEVHYDEGFIYFTLDGEMVSTDFRICCEAQQSDDGQQHATYVSYMDGDNLVEYCAFNPPCIGTPIDVNDGGYVIWEMEDNTVPDDIYQLDNGCYQYVGDVAYCQYHQGIGQDADGTVHPPGSEEFQQWVLNNQNTVINNSGGHNACFTEVNCNNISNTIYSSMECCAWYGYKSQEITIPIGDDGNTETYVVCVDMEAIMGEDGFNTMSSAQDDITDQIDMTTFLIDEFEFELDNNDFPNQTWGKG